MESLCESIKPKTKSASVKINLETNRLIVNIYFTWRKKLSDKFCY